MSCMTDKEWDSRYATSDYVWTVKVNQFVERHLADLPPASAVDLGAGEGRNAVWLAKKGWTVTAVDFSEAALDKGRALAAEHGVGINFVQADATRYRPDNTVDLVVLSYLQLETPDRLTVLDHARTWLNPGGTLFLIAHDQTNVSRGYGGPPAEAVCYDLDETVAALVGLDVALAEVAERQVETADGPRTALDTLVIARRPADSD